DLLYVLDFANSDPRLPDPIRQSPDRKSTRLNSSHVKISYAVRCLKKKTVDDVAERVVPGEDELVDERAGVARGDVLDRVAGPLLDVVAQSVTELARVVDDDPQDFVLFFFNVTATAEIYTLSLHDALPISIFSTCSTSPIAIRACRTPSASR